MFVKIKHSVLICIVYVKYFDIVKVNGNIVVFVCLKFFIFSQQNF